MYERHFNLRERPFSLSPDPAYLYPSPGHQEALSYIRYGIEGHAGFVVLTGEIGSGKTTLLQTALRDLDQHTSVSRLVNTMLDARELLEAILLDFGLDPGHGRSKPYLLHDLARFLVDQRTAGRLALLVVDEAQNLNPLALEELRMISNLETEKSKLIQILLVGQPSLRDLLAEPALEQLRQRVTVNYHLQPLDSAETAAYINHRLRRAALGTPLEFSRDVTHLIHRYSQGVPRKINVIADAVLVFGYGEDRRTIDVDLTNIVLNELETTGVLAPPVRANVPRADLLPALAAREREFAARTAALAEREDRIAEQQRALLRERWVARGHAASGPSTLNAEQLGERGARMTRRDDPEYRDYFNAEQRHPTAGYSPRPFQRGDGEEGRAVREVVLDQRGQATTGPRDESPAPPARLATEVGRSERRAAWPPAYLAPRPLTAAGHGSIPASAAALRGADPYYRAAPETTNTGSLWRRIIRGLLGD
jgi:general secretion pathway protein A